MERLVAFTVYGKPEGARRHRTARTKAGHVRTYHGGDHVSAEDRLVSAAMVAWKGQPKVEGPVEVQIHCWFYRPKALLRKMDRGTGTKPYTGKPDADNVAKLVMDALTKAGVWRDDTQVSDLVVRRAYLPLDLEGREEGLACTQVWVHAM